MGIIKNKISIIATIQKTVPVYTIWKEDLLDKYIHIYREIIIIGNSSSRLLILLYFLCIYMSHLLYMYARVLVFFCYSKIENKILFVCLLLLRNLNAAPQSLTMILLRRRRRWTTQLTIACMCTIYTLSGKCVLRTRTQTVKVPSGCTRLISSMYVQK